MRDCVEMVRNIEQNKSIFVLQDIPLGPNDEANSKEIGKDQ